MVTQNDIFFIFNQFEIASDIKDFDKLNSGHINDTYCITTVSNSKFILQKMNNSVFKNIKAVFTNKVIVSKHLLKTKSNYKTIELINTRNGLYYFIDQNKDYWNLMTYILNSKTFEVAESTKLVFEAGKLYGDFLARTDTLPVEQVIETFTNFHSIDLRFHQFENALSIASNTTKNNAKTSIAFVYKYKEDAYQLSKLKPEFPIRITHNDTKLSNILFNHNNEGIAVIDLDTVMPGIVHFDFGDSIRSICSNAKEDEIDLDKVTINLEYYEAFCKGYALATKPILTIKEIKYFPLAIKTIIYIIGLRFLTDYLNNNIYYKTTYETHNLDRAKNQFALFKNVDLHYNSIESITQKAFK